MATTVYETTEIELLDGTKIRMRPLKISLLRDFMKKFAEVAEVADDNDASMDILLECVQIAMKQDAPDLLQIVSALRIQSTYPPFTRLLKQHQASSLMTGNLTAGLPGTN